MRFLLCLLPLLSACSTDTVRVDDTDDDADTGADADTADSAPTASPWAGVHEGRLALEVEDPRLGERMAICEGGARVSVTDDGRFDGDGLCETDMGPADIAVRFEGGVDEEGIVRGTATLDLLDGEARYDLTGTTDVGVLSFTWEGEISAPEGQLLPVYGVFSD